MNIPLVTEIQRFSLQDGPGIRTTIFVKGCALHCPWCHNPEAQNPKHEFYFYASTCTACGQCVEVCSSGASTIVTDPDKDPLVKIDRDKCILCMKCVEACVTGAREEVGQQLDMESIVKEAIADKPFSEHSGGGVTISGGEPLLFPDFTLALASILKKKEKIHVAVETSCFPKWEIIKPLLPFIDLFIVDIKTMDAEKHGKVIGASLEIVLQNIERLIAANATLRIHLPIIPGFNDSEADTETYVRYLGQFSEKLAGVDILPYHSYGVGKYTNLGREYQLKDIEDLPGERIMPLAKILKQTGLKQVTVGGLVGMTALQGQ